MLTGPITGRGRNEGYVKSPAEIRELYPIFDIPAGAYHARLAARGMTWADYRQGLRHPFNLNCYPDTFETIEEAERREVVSHDQANRLRRHLCFCDFLNTQTIVAALEAGAITTAEARVLFFDWLDSVGDYRTLNLYILPGNGHMARRAARAGLISQEEARYLLAQWVVHLPRLDAALLDDAAYLGLLSASDMDTLVRRELVFFRRMLKGWDEDIPVPPALAPELERSNRQDLARLRKRLRSTMRRPASIPEALR